LEEKFQLFYQFNLEDAVPDDHLVRRIEPAINGYARYSIALVRVTIF
jgi:hypothetical protein